MWNVWGPICKIFYDSLTNNAEVTIDLTFDGRLIYTLEGKYSLESTDPRESEIRAHLRP